MKKMYRILGLTSALTLASLATANAQFQQYGSCSAWCDGNQYVLSNVTYGQCCYNLNHFGESCYTVGWEWYPYGEGDSMFCGG